MFQVLKPMDVGGGKSDDHCHFGCTGDDYSSAVVIDLMSISISTYARVSAAY